MKQQMFWVSCVVVVGFCHSARFNVVRDFSYFMLDVYYNHWHSLCQTLLPSFGPVWLLVWQSDGSVFMTIYSGGVTKYGYRIISCCFLVRVSIYIEKNMQVLSTDLPDSPAWVTTSSLFVLDIVVSFPWNMAMDKWQSVCVIKRHWARTLYSCFTLFHRRLYQILWTWHHNAANKYRTLALGGILCSSVQQISWSSVIWSPCKGINCLSLGTILNSYVMSDAVTPIPDVRRNACSALWS